jgi:hypothetical protein
MILLEYMYLDAHVVTVWLEGAGEELEVTTMKSSDRIFKIQRTSDLTREIQGRRQLDWKA